jgi:hypothetical protein
MNRQALARWSGPAVAINVFVLAGCGAGDPNQKYFAGEGDDPGSTSVSEAPDAGSSASAGGIVGRGPIGIGPRDAGGDTSTTHDGGKQVDAGAPSNPLSPVVAYEQYNLTESCGSCGSHAGAVAMGYFWGNTSTSQVLTIEEGLYSNYGLPCRPGPGDLVTAYNKYLTKWLQDLPWKAVYFTSSSDVQGYIDKGSPVIANTSQWGGHYVAIYGLKPDGNGTTMVYFSDGTAGTGLSESLPTGNLKEWTWSSFLAYAATDQYIGFQHQ